MNCFTEDKQKLPFAESVADNLVTMANKYSSRHALWANGKFYTYQQLYTAASKIASALREINEDRCVILCDRSELPYISILAVLLAGKAYAVLGCGDPFSRIYSAFLQLNTSLIIADNNHIDVIKKIAENSDNELSVLFPEMNNHSAINNISNNVHILSPGVYSAPTNCYKYAYIMFTSGTSGIPKGIAITHSNLKAYINNITMLASPNEYDRFSQITELNFDFSVHDIFACWSVGACLYVLPRDYFMGIPNYINNNQITFWASVPSTIALLKQLNRLKNGSFHSIRYTMFCGEALTNEIAKLWHSAAPNSIIDNLYGPTEATVAITGLRWNLDLEAEIIPIGFPFAGQNVVLLDSCNKPVTRGTIGEIGLCGSQVADQYWCDVELSRQRFVNLTIPELNIQNIVCYKTGDLALYDEKYGLIYKGRCDDQIKIRGYRVEKVEIESAIRKIAETEMVAIISQTIGENKNIQSLICYLSGTSKSAEQIMKLCKERLPAYMLPNQIVILEKLPFNKNGKVDYQKLLQYQNAGK